MQTPLRIVAPATVGLAGVVFLCAALLGAQSFQSTAPIGSDAPTPSGTPTATPTVSPCLSVITQSSSQAITRSWSPCLNGPTPTATATATATAQSTPSKTVEQTDVVDQFGCCVCAPCFYQQQNSYWRAFNMSTFVGGAQYNVTSVAFGMAGVSTGATVTVRLYTNNSGFPFPAGPLTLIGSSNINVVHGQNNTIVTVPLSTVVPAGTMELVMELFTPDGTCCNMTFGVGANDAPESGPSYWSNACDTAPHVIGGHIVFNIYGSCSAPTTPTPTPTPSPCQVLYDQSDNAATGGVVSQNFETANNTYDSQAADDFVVPAMQNWMVQQIKVNGTYFDGPGPAASVNLTFYVDSGGLPGAVVPNANFTDVSMSDTAGNFTIFLPTTFILTGGAYWVSVQANMDFDPSGEWAWSDRMVTSNSPAVWQNPGGGFATSCATYGRRGADCGIDPGAPDQVFQILGCPVTTPPVTISGTVSYCSNPANGPIPNVSLTLGGNASGLTSSDASGNYMFWVPSGGYYTVTPTKVALSPGSPAINTTDVVAVQRHFLRIGTPLSGCRVTAADVNADGSINTIDVLAIQRFFLVQSTGTANVGKYLFVPVNRSYPGVVNNQTNQNYDALVLGDVTTPYVH